MFSAEFERLKSIAKEQKADEKFHMTDFSKISTRYCRVYNSLKRAFVLKINLEYFPQQIGKRWKGS